MARTVFRGANLLDGSSAARPSTTVVIEGERIEAVGSDEEIQPRPDDRLIDLAGRTLMPGLITSHYHSTYQDIVIIPAPLGLEKPPGYLTLVAANHVREALYCGFTGLISAGAIVANIDAELKLAIEEGVVEGPRMMAGGLAIDSTGDYNDTGSYWWQLGNPGAQVFCDGPDELRKAVRREIKRGVQMIKIFASGGHGVPDDRATRGFTLDELRAIVEATHQRGAKVRAHCAWRDLILECAREGVDCIDHGDEMDDACIEAVLSHDTTVCPSQYFVKRMLEYDGPVPVATEDQLVPLRREFENACAATARANAAGVRMVIGDDYGVLNVPHGSYAKELEFYVKEVGIPPLDVLRWATLNGATLMGRDAELGSVEPGKLADLLVVDGDPSVDIGLLQDRARLLAIVKGGSFVKDSLAGHLES